MTSARTPYFAQIDALRAMTIIPVMIYHINNAWIPGGFAGVDVFFAISGYVISRSMVELDTSRLSRFVSGFYARRLLRILPALLVVLLVSATVTTLFVPVSWLSDANYTTARYAFWGFGNYGLLNSGDSYFAPRIDFNPFAHTWSLGVEEQFYLLFPLVFFVWLRFHERESARRFTGTILLALLFAVSLGYSAYVSAHSPSLAYYLLPSRFWELAAGGLLFQLHAHNLRLTGRRPGPQTVQLLIAFGLYLAAIIFSKETAFPWPWGLLAVAATLLAIDAVTAKRDRETRLAQSLRSPVLVWIGKLSYSLYLWHWPIFALFNWTIGMESWATRILAVALTFALSWATYTWVENPFRRGALVRSKRRMLVVAGGLASMLLFSRAASYMHERVFQFTRSVTWDFGTWYPVDLVEMGKVRNGDCVLSHTVTPLKVGGSRETYRRTGCAGLGAAPTLFVTGDSHAEGYRRLLSMIGASGSFDVQIFFLGGCTPFKMHDPAVFSTTVCRAFDREVLDQIAATHKPGDVLFLPSLRVPRLGDQWAVFSETEAAAHAHGEGPRRSREQAIDEAFTDLKPLLDDGLRVVLEAPKPVFKAPAYRCSDWFNRNNPICANGLTLPRRYLLDLRHPILVSLEGLAARHHGMSVWDPFDILCPGETCAAVTNGVPLFFDGDHLSGRGNELLYPSFLAHLERLRAPAAAGS